MFERETAVARADPRQAFFWLIAVLGAPGLLLIFVLQFAWNDTYMRGGWVALEVTSLAHKATFLNMTMIGITFIASVGWNALGVDRRDALILGYLPVRSATIALAKLASLGQYIGLVAVGMHAGAALLVGLLLGGFDGPLTAVRTAAAHFVALAGFTVFVFTAIAALQATAAALAGPRRFARVSLPIQTFIIAATLFTLASMPGSPGELWNALTRSTGSSTTTWLPPVWFLALYEAVAGHTVPETGALALRAVLALVLSVGTLVVATSVSTMTVMTAGGGVSLAGTLQIARWFARSAVWVMVRTPLDRGLMQFTLAALARQTRPRIALVIAIATALSIGVALFASLNTPAEMSAHRTSLALLALPFVTLFSWLLGLRAALSLPCELDARWIFDSASVSPHVGRRIARRLLWGLGAIPLSAATALWWLSLWDTNTAMWRSLVVLVAAAWLIEVFLWGYVGVPTAHEPAPGDPKVRTFVCIIALELCAGVFPYALGTPVADFALVKTLLIFMAVVLIGTRIGGDLAAMTNAQVPDNEAAVLDLALVPPATSGERSGRA